MPIIIFNTYLELILKDFIFILALLLDFFGQFFDWDGENNHVGEFCDKGNKTRNKGL